MVNENTKVCRFHEKCGHYIVLLVSILLLLSIPVRMIIRKLNNAIPDSIIHVILAILIGIMIALVGSLRKYVYILLLSPQNVLRVYVPIYIVSSIYQMDYYIFIRCLPQVFTISIFGILFTPLFLGIILSFILHTHWTYLQGILAALAVTPVQPVYVTLLFKELSKNKYLGTILEAESVIIAIPIVIFYELCFGLQQRIITKWYQFVLVIVRYLAGGIIVGCILGKIKAKLMCCLYNEPLNVICVSISMTYFTMFLSEYVLCVSGTVAVGCAICFVALEKHRFTSEVDAAISCFWGTFHYLADVGLFMLGTVELIIYIVEFFHVQATYGTVIMYLSGITVRFVRFLILGPLLNRMTYEMNFKCLLVLSWSDVKGCINLHYLLMLLGNPFTMEIMKSFLIEALSYIFLSILLNSSTMKLILSLIGLSDLSTARRTNMNNCMKFIMEKRYAIINILKMNRYLTNANWSIVREETMIEHPYKLKASDEDYDEDALWNESNSTMCPDCHKEVPFDVSEKELGELLKETRLKVLRAKIISIIKQYENGVTDKNCLQVLVHNLEILVESDKRSNTVDLKLYLRRSKLIGLSNGVLFISAMKPYFIIKWNIFDFVLLFLGLPNLIFYKPECDWIMYHVVFTFPTLALIRLLGIIRLVGIFCPHIIRLIDFKIDSQQCFGFDLATAMVYCAEEILDTLQHLIEMKLIRDLYRKEIIDERMQLVKQMEIIQKEKPWIAITVKTRQAIRNSLTAMEETLNGLKVSGFVDSIEYNLIYKEIFQKEKFLRNLKFVQPSPPEVIFNEVPWMVGDTVMIEFLYNKVTTVSWDAGETIIKEGTHSNGIYIVVTGMLRMKYEPKEMPPSDKPSHIPIIDYLSTTEYGQRIEDNIMSGNTIGELCVLTNRPYDCSISADSPSQAYYLTSQVLQEAMNLNSNPVNGLEARMWKCAVCNLAVAIMMEVPLYQSYTQEQIKLKLERSFMPNLRCYKMFVVTELMDDIILIEGVVGDYSSGEVFTAPVLIPRTTQKLILPKSSCLNVDENIDTRLLIIPMADAEDFEIMENEEEIAELVSNPSSRCLLHYKPVNQYVRKKTKYPGGKHFPQSVLLSQPSSNMLLYVWNEDKEIINLDSEQFLREEDGSIQVDIRPSTYMLKNKHLLSADSISEESDMNTDMEFNRNMFIKEAEEEEEPDFII